MKQILGDKLHHLRQYVETTDSIHPEQRDVITKSLDEIEEALPESEEQTDAADATDALHHPLRALKSAIENIEANHPEAVAGFQKICDTLARMGI